MILSNSSFLNDPSINSHSIPIFPSHRYKIHPLALSSDRKLSLISQKNNTIHLKLFSPNQKHPETLFFSTGALCLKNQSRSLGKTHLPLISEFKLKDSDSDKSLKEKLCRICFEDGQAEDIISPCSCKGSAKYVHSECLKAWLVKSGKASQNISICEVCKEDFCMKFFYTYKRVAWNEDSVRFWVPVWVLLMVVAGIFSFYYRRYLNKSPTGVVIIAVSVIFALIGLVCCYLAVLRCRSAFFVRDVVEWKILSKDN